VDDLIRSLHRLSGRYVPYLQPYWDEEDLSYVANWLKSGALEDARKKLMDCLKFRFPRSASIVLTDTGKSALYVALRALRVEQGKEVIVPSYCCASVIAAVVRAGCAPVLADSDNHFNISEESVAAALSPRTGAILVPHLFGLRAASLEAIVSLGKGRGIPVIEDVAQAYGLRLANGDLAGTLGDASIFSAGIGKPIMGPGGGWMIINKACSTNFNLASEPIAEERARIADFLCRFTGPRALRGRSEIVHALPARIMGRLPRTPSFDINVWAEKECQVRTIAAGDAWLAARQIERFDTNLERRRQNARRWASILATARIPCTTLPDQANTHAVWPLLFGRGGERRAIRVRRILEREGVATEPCYTPLHLREHGRDFRRTDMKTVDSISPAVFAVPVRPNLLPNDWERIERAAIRASRALAA
jgi:dTDP-4-amino-4,6-dideoxygalactose transaminase